MPRPPSDIYQSEDIRQIDVYMAVCISVLLFDSETWTAYRTRIRQLESFPYTVSSESIRPNTGGNPSNNWLRQHRISTKEQLRRVGHVIQLIRT